MSADNWAVCPRCESVEIEKAEILQREVRESYGVIPFPEWDALRAEANKPLLLNPTFRENYEWSLCDGEVYGAYLGKCSICGLETRLECSKRIWPED